MPELKIIAFTMYDDEDYYYRMVELGVKGFILKSSGINELEMAIEQVMLGESYFSNEILRKIIVNFFGAVVTFFQQNTHIAQYFGVPGFWVIIILAFTLRLKS